MKQEDLILKLYGKRNEFLQVPRYYPWLQHISSYHTVADQRSLGAEAHFEFIGSLIEEPTRDQPSAVQALIETDGGILAAAPGKGKTVMAIAALSQIGRRALIKVPTEFLMQQWIDNFVGNPIKGIKALTNLCREDIGIVQGDVCDYRHPVVVAMVQSLSLHRYPKDFYASIGIDVTDEVHRIGAPTWLETIGDFPAKRRWGLSATVERRDGMHEAFMMHIGPVVYEMLDLSIKPRVSIIDTGIELPQSSYTNRWNGQINLSKLYTVLGSHKGRNELLVRHLKMAVKAGRKVLALSRRLEQLQIIYDMYGNSVECGMLSRKLKPHEKDAVLKNKRLILATEQVAGLGLDQPDLDTMFWLTPSQNVEQNVGRLLRMEGAKQKFVIDPIDNVPILRGMGQARERKFLKQGYEVKKFV